ncbi:MAG: pirin family protein [Deltaproteobacteria bacterium]|nr:pirin family protein [Nannocystaceae bacterium]
MVAVSIEHLLESRPRDVAGLAVRRVLPVLAQRSVGPFVFFDHMGPAVLAPGTGVDVPPHPHIGLATVTYLFAGELVHRDTLGSHQVIRPGDVNWMAAGRGIAHSERSGEAARAEGATVHGIQSWFALPKGHEQDAPSFEHHGAASLPVIERGGSRLTIVAGTAWGERSPVGVLSPTLYVDARFDTDATVVLDEEHEQRAVYVAEGELEHDGKLARPGMLMVLAPGGHPELRAHAATRAMLLGGAKLDGPRHIWWNFVASDATRIEQAKRDWAEDRFGEVPGDSAERVPLPSR